MWLETFRFLSILMCPKRAWCFDVLLFKFPFFPSTGVSVIIWSDWSKKLSSPHPPPLVLVDGATFVVGQQRPPLVLRCRPGLDAAELPATYEICYESRSRRQQRPCQSLPPECLRSWTRVQLRRHAGGKDLRCFLGVSCCRRRYVLICWSYIAGSCCFSPLLFCVR